MGTARARRVYWGALLAALASSPVEAGGFAYREQSAPYQGTSFAGSAAGGTLSSMFWNPAAMAVFPGLNSESSYSLIFPEADVNVRTSSDPFGMAGSTDVASWQFVSASYWAYQLAGYNPNLFLGVAFNSPFGLATEPEDRTYEGAVLARSSRITTYNLNPNVAYRIAPGVFAGVGLQVQYAKVRFGVAPEAPLDPSLSFRGDDVAFGATAGILLQPRAGTSIGLGWRSQITHDLDGDVGIKGLGREDASAKLRLPDIVTFSVSQALAPSLRLLGTVEWSNWSRLEEIRFRPSSDPDVTLPVGWSDGWLFALGGEYDWSRQLTLRTGIAYEISPAGDARSRILAVPDADRILLSAGASWRWSDSTMLDFAYTHAFYGDADFDQTSIGPIPVHQTGTVDLSSDIVTIGLRTRWGGQAPLK
jgi:long-chain fatty acid transport protein